MNVLSGLQIQRLKGIEVQIQDYVREMIISGKIISGTRLPPTEELASQWGVGSQTVQKALTPLVKAGLLVRRPKAGTFVRQREAKLTCVGIYDVAASLGGSLYEQAMQAVVKEELTRAGIETDLWLDPRPTEQLGEPWMPLVRAAEHREFQAVIVTVTGLPTLRWLQKLPVPTAFQSPAAIPNRVQTDLPQFAELSLRALAQQGCRSVGLICPIPSTVTNPDGTRHVFIDFYERFTDLVHELGLTLRDEWMRVPSSDTQISQEQFGYEEFLKLWRQPERPAGLIVYPDTVVRGVILGLREQHVRVPEDLKLVFHKNESIDLLCPMPATFVINSERAMARALIDQVRKQFHGESCEPISLPFRPMVHSGNSQRETNQAT